MKRSIALALLIVTGVTMSGCGSPDCTPPPEDTPPANATSASGQTGKENDGGIVVIQDWTDIGRNDYVMKACDGTTLLYLTAEGYGITGGTGITAIPDSPECGATATPTEESSPAE